MIKLIGKKFLLCVIIFIIGREVAMENKKGKVILVGAGPGAVELVTVRGLKAIESADVIVYDKYISEEFLSLNPRAEKIYAGKIGGGDFMPQEEISKILYDQAAAGKTVVRLKGGDPFVFGRGGEEVLYLNKLGIETEVVPGISSSIAAPALNNIPVTHRKMARSFTVMTAHSLERSADHINFAALHELGGTIVFLMGRRDRKNIAEKLIEAGFPKNYPAALISAASMPEEKVIRTDLISIVEKEYEIDSPAIIVVGEVVNALED